MFPATPLIRYMYLSANTLCLIVGLIMVLLCVLFMDSVQNLHLIYCILGLLTGLLTIVASFVGYRAIKPPKAVLMWLHCALFTIIFVTQMYIVTHFEASSIITTSAETVELLWERELVNEGPMADIESRFHCCGLHNSSDYTSINLPLPASCYYTENDAWVNYNDGCLEKVKFAAGRASDALSYVGYTMATAQLLALTFSFVLTLIYHRNGDYETL
ncbi:protein late bloomer [Zeugodacus cucurbitae]|uniref:protein late bloomer n=1 Tax=Zeugodacus cucurbitae TaxID=28588 RepID=UPI0023D93D10|nr:protein late bloomer [Zeugodacus cucurbitae]